MQKLMLLDAYALIFRAYYGLIRSPRINSKGQNTSAAFGFINSLEELLRTENPDFVAVAFDPPGGTFRHEQFPEYKATRDETPEDIRWAVPVIKDFLTAYGIKMVEVPNYEADDVIGTLAHRAAKEGLEVVMVTPDKDYAQLVQPGVSMLRPQSGAKGYERLGVEEVKTKFEVENPLQVIDLLGLMGDSADNIPGCPGVGAKTAVKLLADFGSIEGLLSHTDQLKGALKKKVEEHVEQIRESKILATIVTDVPIDVTWDDMQRKTPNKEALVALYEDLEFRTFLRRLTGDAPAAAAPSAEPDLFSQAFVTATNTDEETTLDFQENLSTLADHPHQYHLIESEEDAQELCRNLLTFSQVAFDTETTSVDAMQAQLVGMSFAVEDGTAWYVAVSRETEAAQRMVDVFRPFFEHPSIEKVGQNLKYDLLVLSHYDVEVAGPLFDTMLAHYVVQPEQRHNMDLLAEKYLHYRTIPIEALIGSGRTQRNMADLAPKDIVDYACEDADVTLRLYPILKEEME